MMKRTTLITIILLCFGIGLAAYYRLYLMPPAIEYMKDRQLERPSEYRPLIGKKNEEKLIKFRLADINGVVFDSHDLRGKIVFLNFWTTWCTTCVAEMPAMEKLHQKLKNEDFVMVAINIKESLTQVKNFVSNNNLTFTTLLDLDGETTKSFNVFATPTTFIYGKSGQLLDAVIGFRRWDSKSSISKIKRMIDNE
jgi:thiol-disulfide isomerase/thioredoxin